MLELSLSYAYSAGAMSYDSLVPRSPHSLSRFVEKIVLVFLLLDLIQTVWIGIFKISFVRCFKTFIYHPTDSRIPFSFMEGLLEKTVILVQRSSQST